MNQGESIITFFSSVVHVSGQTGTDVWRQILRVASRMIIIILSNAIRQLNRRPRNPKLFLPILLLAGAHFIDPVEMMGYVDLRHKASSIEQLSSR